MPLQKIGMVVGFAKQSAKGTIAANPTFTHGLTGGSPLVVDSQQSALDVTSSKRVQNNVYRDTVKNGANIQALCYLKTFGAYLLAAIGADTVTGAGPYVHTYSTNDLLYFTVFVKGVDGTIEAVKDCKLDELGLKWDGSKPVEMTAKFMGTNFSYPATFVATVNEENSESFLTPLGGAFTIDPIGSTLVAATVVGGELTIKNNLSPVDPSATVEASDQWEGVQEHSLKLTVIPDDLLAFRKTVTGAGAGTAASVTAPLGSVSLTFKENAAGTGGLVVTGSKIAFLTAFPDADPKGGPIQVELAGLAVLPTAGTAPLVYVLTNGQTAY